MRKLVAAINMTLDGICDHTAVTADPEIHEHYTALLKGGGAIIYGRTTFELMGFWQTLLEKPSGVKSMDDFAQAIDQIPKIVFSRTWKELSWQTATIAKRGVKEEITALKQEAGKDLLVGSPSLIITAMNLGLVDELQLCVHPVIAGSGLPLFKNISERMVLKLLKTKTFGGGAVTFYYEPIKK